MRIRQVMKKGFSLILCVVMLVSCWVFTAPSANAATPGTTYNYTVTIETTNGGDCNDNDSPYFLLYGKGANGTGADEQIFKDTVDPSYIQDKKTYTKSGSSEMFPSKLEIFIDFDGTFMHVTRKWEGNVTIKVNGTTIHSAAYAMESENWFSHCPMTKTIEVSTANYPSLNNVVLTGKGPASITVPRTDQDPVSCNVAAVCVDQYNVILVNKEPSVVTDPANQNIEINQGKMTVKSGANSSDGSDTVYQVIASQGGHSDSYSFTLVNAKYSYVFHDANGNEIPSASGQLKYGQTPTAPETPTKASDATNHYTFTKWSPDVSNLTKDTVYEPKFSSEKHIFNTYESDNNATCTKDGTRTSTCTCGYKHTVADVGSALNHEQNGQSAYVASVTQQPTCTEAGVMTYTCSLCGAQYTQPIEATGHSYEASEVAPTCLEGGYTNHVCSKCGDSYTTDPTPALGHYWGEGTVTTAPTCTEGGQKLYTCSRCQAQRTEDLDALGHKFNKNKWTIVSYPTCTEDGSKYAPCERCSETITEVLPAVGHDWSEWATVKEPTCAEAGKRQRVCSYCEGVEEITLDALGHDMVLKTIDPKDSTPGKLYFQCETCGEINACALNAQGEADMVPNTTGQPLDVDSAALAVPTTTFNNYTREESDHYNYGNRGASLRIDTDLPADSQTIRFAASMTIPEGATIVDYGFVYMWAKDFRKPSTFVIGGSTKVKELSARAGHSSSFQTAEGTVKTYNIVIPVGIDDWDEDILARPYITYTFAGQTFTVYDEFFAQRSVDTIAQAVMDSAKEPRLVKQYISEKIINR